jgi:hypothetical protein
MARYRLARIFVPALVFALMGGPPASPAPANPEPRPPCDGAAPYPAFPPVNAAPAPFVWSDRMLRNWPLPRCLEWSPQPAARTVALAGRFNNIDFTSLLDRFGKVSELAKVNYWSVTDGQWEEIFPKAAPVRSVEMPIPRDDYSVDEVRNGNPLFFRVSGGVFDGTNTFQVAVAGEHRLVARLTPARDPNGFQYVIFLDHQADGYWSFYSLARGPNPGSWDPFGFVGDSGPRYVNRSVALYRFLAGIPTTREPPLCKSKNDCKPAF